MVESNIIKSHQWLRQGLNADNNPLSEYLSLDYFKAEPRTTYDWLVLVRKLTQSSNLSSQWGDLLPNNISIDVLTAYIDNPVALRNSGKLSNDEISELQQPQRVVFFYFLKKLKAFQLENSHLIEHINLLIAQELFRIPKLPAVPDQGILVISSSTDELLPLYIPEGNPIQAIVPNEENPRYYQAKNTQVTYMAQASQWIKLERKNKLMMLTKERIQAPFLNQTLLPEMIKEGKAIQKKNVDFSPAFIIASDQLFMEEGIRKIILTLHFKEDVHTDFDFWISTELEWRPLNGDQFEQVKLCKGSKNQFTFTLNSEFPPIQVLNDDSLSEEELLATQKMPCLKIQSRDLSPFEVEKFTIQTQVTGLRPNWIRNQDEVLDPTDNFLPFGSDAPVGALFTFSDPELINRPLKTMRLTPNWIGKPEDITNYYKAYHKSESDFKVNIYSKSQPKLNPKELLPEQQTLDQALFKPQLVFQPALQYKEEHIPHLFPKEDEEIEGDIDPLNKQACFQLELSPVDFGQSDYALLMANYSIELNAKFLSNNTEPESIDPVNLPYTPQWSFLLIDYLSEPQTWSGENNSVLGAYLSTPIMNQAYTPSMKVDLGDFQHGGLLIGLDSIKIGEYLNFYFFGDIRTDIDQPALPQWAYLSENGWKEIHDEDLFSDTTCGLKQPGIVTLMADMEMEDQAENTLYASKYWFRVTFHPKSSHQHSEPLVPLNIQGIYPNAVPMVRDFEKEIEPVMKDLPTDSTFYLEEDELGYEFSLPVPTYGVLPEESQKDYFVRVFAQMRNRKRAQSYQDFENILIANNRNLQMVKAIGLNEENEMELVASKRPYKLSRLIPKRPNLSIHECKTIEEGLSSALFPFIGEKKYSLKVKNPVFRPVGYQAVILLNPGYKEQAALNLFYKDFSQFINPWLLDATSVPLFGCWIDYGSLINFFQQQPYIKMVISVELRISSKKTLEENEPIWYTPNFPIPFQEDEVMVPAEYKYCQVDFIKDINDLNQGRIGEMKVNKNNKKNNKDNTNPWIVS
ncbi:hypothetical protein [Aureibacter tunicatorum]|uniref:Baseplate J-like protein n=1 Tax=Aureibacter tunicatorum TaxID=866807 RepID=A0AAE3XQ78_9BACT|nr:hypothetical protein [Aureibacter tunicatorum]MDR6240045.1 hypothetical protein [Aureibacter tunicatorum]BDD04517.1 hypothetical protein AUTU_20000 [Aureibacter tunicatorum]